jgi:hypothetical protein
MLGWSYMLLERPYKRNKKEKQLIWYEINLACEEAVDRVELGRLLAGGVAGAGMPGPASRRCQNTSCSSHASTTVSFAPHLRTFPYPPRLQQQQQLHLLLASNLLSKPILNKGVIQCDRNAALWIGFTSFKQGVIPDNTECQKRFIYKHFISEIGTTACLLLVQRIIPIHISASEHNNRPWPWNCWTLRTHQHLMPSQCRDFSPSCSITEFSSITHWCLWHILLCIKNGLISLNNTSCCINSILHHGKHD